jgi:hypothetical protein
MAAATRDGHDRRARLLRRAKYSEELVHGTEVPPCFIAAMDGDLPTVEAYLGRGGDVNMSNGFTVSLEVHVRIEAE